MLVGQKGIGKGNGLEQWKQSTAGNVTISTTIINGAVTGFFGGGNTASALTSAETRITQTENSIRLKADQTIVDGINTRLQSAEAKITPDAIKLTVKSQTETIAANAAKRTELWMDARGLDVTKYYPITIGMNATIPYIITVQRTLYAGHGKPSWSTHNEGFSVMCRWQSNGSGWGTIAIQRTILDYAYGFANVVPVGSISQITEASLEYIYVRGGSKYCVIVEGATGVNISLKTSAYTWTSGTTARTLDIKTEVTAPLVDLKQRPTTDTIKSQITLDGFGVSVFGKKIDFTGQVTFNSLNSALQSTINDKASSSQLNTLRNSLKGMAYQDMVTLAKLDTTIIEGGHIKTSLIDANAIVTGTLVAGIISTTDITTGRLTATTGAKIGGFKVEGDRLTSADAKGSLMIGDNMVRFFRINEYGTANQSAALLQIRNDKGSAVSLSGGANKTVLSIIGNGAYYAIESYGSHRFGQRQYEKWDAPGVLWAARITSGGGISGRWGNGCNVTSASRTDTGNYVFWHDLGHTEYFIIATGVNENWTLCIISDKQAKTFTVKTFHKDQGWINSAFEVAIIGRNRTV